MTRLNETNKRTRMMNSTDRPYSFAELLLSALAPVTWSASEARLVVDPSRLDELGGRYAIRNLLLALLCFAIAGLLALPACGGSATAAIATAVILIGGACFSVSAARLWRLARG